MQRQESNKRWSANLWAYKPNGTDQLIDAVTRMIDWSGHFNDHRLFDLNLRFKSMCLGCKKVHIIWLESVDVEFVWTLE